MILGISTALETCLILGQVSHNSLLFEEVLDGYMWSGVEIDEKTVYIQARSLMARTLKNNGEERQAEGEAKVV